jgi:hypothetical protein
MAGCGFFSAGRQHAKALLTGRNRASAEVIVFSASGFSNRAGVGFLPPIESGAFVKPQGAASLAYTATGDTFTDTQNNESPSAADRAGASAEACHHRQMKTHASYAYPQGGASA